MIKTLTKILYNEEDLFLFLKRIFNIKGNVSNPEFKQKIFNDYIFRLGYEMPKTYPCLVTTNIYEDVYDQLDKKEDWNFRWYYYDDIIKWEQEILEYKNAMKNKIKVSENENFIL